MSLKYIKNQYCCPYKSEKTDIFWMEFFPNFEAKKCPKTFRPKLSFVKSVPGVLRQVVKVEALHGDENRIFKGSSLVST
jgi:hypothetical protein